MVEIPESEAVNVISSVIDIYFARRVRNERFRDTGSAQRSSRRLPMPLLESGRIVSGPSQETRGRRGAAFGLPYFVPVSIAARRGRSNCTASASRLALPVEQLAEVLAPYLDRLSLVAGQFSRRFGTGAA